MSKYTHIREPIHMAGAAGLEPATSRFEVWRSIQLIVRAGMVICTTNRHFATRESSVKTSRKYAVQCPCTTVL
jgi:hypothetical protein